MNMQVPNDEQVKLCIDNLIYFDDRRKAIKQELDELRHQLKLSQKKYYDLVIKPNRPQ